MALNKVILRGASRDPEISPHEIIIKVIESGITLSLYIPAPLNGPGAGKERNLNAAGRLWITDTQLIFVGPPENDLESLSVPLYQISSTAYEKQEPVQSDAGKLVLEIEPSSSTLSGGLRVGATAEIEVDGQPFFSIVNTINKSCERAAEARRSPWEQMAYLMSANDDPVPYYELMSDLDMGDPPTDYTLPPDSHTYMDTSYAV